MRSASSRTLALVAAVALVATACARDGSIGPRAQDGPITAPVVDADPGPCVADPVPFSPHDVEASGLDWIPSGDLPASFPEPLIERSRIVPVLGPDGIPAIDEPNCVAAQSIDFLTDNAPVVVVEVNGDVRAYPLEILTWHELVNDTIGGEAITVSYCPLCNSAVAYERRVGDLVLDFGTSGSLTQSSMVMYDRQTETLWTHFDGRAFAGELTGERLELVSSAVVAFGDFRDEFPNALVLSRDTGFTRDYGLNPYPQYDVGPSPITRFITDAIDDRLPSKQRVVGVELDDEAVAIVRADIEAVGAIDFALVGRDLTVWNVPGTASALEGYSVSGGIDIGAVAVFDRVVDGQALTFSRDGEGIVDDQTGSRWSIFGTATSGELEGTQLEAVTHLDTFWFSWSRFFPDTNIHS